MHAMSDETELLIELEQVTHIDGAKWRRIASLPPSLQALELACYADQDWSDPAEPAGQRVLEIISALGGIGSAVGNVAGAITGIRAI
jgi:hypothetical protein